jgi:hypothetical protein
MSPLSSVDYHEKTGIFLDKTDLLVTGSYPLNFMRQFFKMVDDKKLQLPPFKGSIVCIRLK